MGKIDFKYGPEVVTVAEFARISGKSQTTIRRLIARRKLTSFHNKGLPVLIVYEDARRWMEGLPLGHGTYHVTIHR